MVAPSVEEHRLGPGRPGENSRSGAAARKETPHPIVLLIELRVADHRHDAWRPRYRAARLVRLAVAGYRPVDEVDDLGLQPVPCPAWRRARVEARCSLEGPSEAVRHALCPVAPFDHAGARQLDGGGSVGDGEKPSPPASPGWPALASCAGSCGILIETSPKSISTGHGVTQRLQMVQWSAMSLNSSKWPARRRAGLLPRRGSLSPAGRCRGSCCAGCRAGWRGTWVEQTCTPQRRQCGHHVVASAPELAPGSATRAP